MARERWFWAQGARQRRGPLLLPELVDRVLGQPDPRSVLVWRKGLKEWTRAEHVPEVHQRIAPLVASRDSDDATARRTDAIAAGRAGAPGPPLASPPPAGSNLAVYGGLAAGLALMGLLAWLFWPRPSLPRPVPLGGTSTDTAPAVVLPAGPAAASRPSAPASSAAPPAAASQAPSVAVRETELPRSELRRLRGVAAWSGDRLTLTVYNGSDWRVTEVVVRVTRFDGQELVEDPLPLRLLPPGDQVDKGVADLLSKVAPDRPKPGLNALDTGPFEGRAGAQPENFRWQFESARGDAPR
jgi:hypothetical protein